MPVLAPDAPGSVFFPEAARRIPRDVGITGSPGLMTSFRQAVERSVRNRTASKSRFVYSLMIADRDPELERLLKAERLAFNRYDGLRGYPGDVQEIALDLWTEAQDAVRDYRAKHP